MRTAELTTWLGEMWAKAVMITQGSAKYLAQLGYDFYHQIPRHFRRRNKKAVPGSAGFYAVVVGRVHDNTSGKLWLQCKKLDGNDSYDPDGPNIYVFAGYDCWFTCGDRIAVFSMRAPAQGRDPYSMVLFAVMNPPIDYLTMDEPQSACIVAAPVPCIADPPEPDPCVLPQP